MRIGIVLALAVLPFSLYAASESTVSDYEREQTQLRISPVGKVRIKQESGSVPAATVGVKEPEEAKKVAGQDTYEQHCAVCHRDGVAGAPKFRNADDWKPRLAQADINALTVSAIKGKNAMPAKGTCTDCTEADLKAAVQYMVPQS